jgi:hypothetical protein
VYIPRDEGELSSLWIRIIIRCNEDNDTYIHPATGKQAGEEGIDL